MKKVEIRSSDAVEKEIDWSKPMWVQHVQRKDFIILTTGEHSATGVFVGTSLPCSNSPYGSISKAWVKDYFKPLEGEVPFIISNND